MHTVDLMEQAVQAAKQQGYSVRQEWLGGVGGGACEYGGRKWLYVDLDLSPLEQLGQVVDALRNDSHIDAANLSPQLAQLITGNSAATVTASRRGTDASKRHAA